MRVGNISIGVAGAALAYALNRLLADRQRAREIREALANGFECVDLSDIELQCAGEDAPITVATVYEGILGPEQVDSLRARVAAAARANPWLCGRLAPGADRRRWIAVYAPSKPPDSTLAEALVHVVDDPRLRPGLPLAEANALLYAHDMGGGALLSAQGRTRGPVFRVTAVRGEGACAVVVALSHTAGDTSTLYRVHRMVAGIDPVEPLVFQRVPAPHEGPRAAGARWLMVGPVQRFSLAAVLSVLRRRQHHVLLELDQAAIAAAKAARAHDPSGPAPYVSSWDVTAAALYRALGGEAGAFTVSLRGRVPGVTAAHAGNYLALAVAPAWECQRPEGVRAALRAALGEYGLPAADDGRLPGLPCALAWRVALLTSWRMGPTEMPLPGCRAVGHFPTWIPGVSMPRFAVIFDAGPGRVAVAAHAHSAAAADALRAMPIAKGPLVLAW